jgi:hemerythrin superfamily protein
MVNASVGSAPEILRKDHDVIAGLFRKFEAAESDHRKKKIGDRCLRAIEIHVALGEKVLYPAVRRDLGEDRRAAQALAEISGVKRIVAELKELPAGERYNDRFRALREIVFALIDEEESVILPRVESSDMDIEQLGAQLLEKKRRLAPSAFDRVAVRPVAAAAAGVALAGAAVWLASLLRGGRRARR